MALDLVIILFLPLPWVPTAVQNQMLETVRNTKFKLQDGPDQKANPVFDFIW